jgi:hypothetical protein
MKSILLMLTMTLFISTTAFSAPEFTDSEAQALLEQRWNALSDDLKLGQLKFSASAQQRDFEQGIITYSMADDYRAYQHIGLISIEPHIPIANMVVETTAKGAELAQQWGLPPRPGWFRVKHGRFHIEKIIKNEVQQKGAETYRVVTATYKAQWTPEYKRKTEIADSIQLADDRKAIILFKYDSSKSEWIIITRDVANRDEEFKTTHVSKMLSQ